MSQVACFVGIVVVITLAVVLGSTNNATTDCTFTSLLRLPDPPNLSASCQKHDGNTPVVIPMRADDNGIFLVDIGIEDDKNNTQWIKAAVDTGSEALLVAGDDCKGCEEGIHLGTVKQDGPILRKSVIRYGSQQDTVVWRKKQLRIPSYLHTCDPRDKDGAHTDTVQCIVGDCPCAIVEKRTGTSDYNILGLGSQNPNGPPAVLSTLFPKTPRAFQITVHSSEEARLVLHNPTGERCRTPRYKFAAKDQSLGHAHHYLVIGHTPTLFQSGAMGAGNAGFVVSRKKYDVLFDTGSNAISLPADIYDRVQDRNYNKGAMALTFDTLNGDDSMTLRIDYDRRDRFNAQVLRSHGELLIIGITFIAGHTLGFEDDGTRRIMTMDFM